MKQSKTIIHWLASQPAMLFLIDAAGAGVTLASLLIMRQFPEWSGMPPQVIEQLMLVPAVFCCYSFACYLFVKSNRSFFIRTIGIANFSYCCLTLWLVFLHYSTLTFWGLAYFPGEIIIVCALAYIELRVAAILHR